MRDWHKHGLALVLLTALNLGLWGRLYSPLDYASPEGEAASAAVTRFISENPNPWGWNPTVNGGQPTQDTALPAFHYAAALLAKLGNEPVYAHRLVAVTMALVAPMALYFLLVTLGMSWPWALATACGSAVLSPCHYSDSFLPYRLEVLADKGNAPYVAALTLILMALALVWRAAHDRGVFSLFLAAVALSLVALTSTLAAFVLLLLLAVLELTMLGIAGEFGFSHRRVLVGVVWAFFLSCFWLKFVPIAELLHSPVGLPWMRMALLAVAIRLCFLGRRQPLFCFALLAMWSLSYLAGYPAIEGIEIEIFVLIALFVGISKGLGDRRWLCRGGAVVALVMLFGCRFTTDLHLEFRIPTIEKLQARVRDWRGNWGMSRPSQSREFQTTRWFVEHPPRGRIFVTRDQRHRLNAWVSFPIAGDSSTKFARPQLLTAARLNEWGAEYLLTHSDFETKLPRVYVAGNSAIFRVPFQSLAITTDGKSDGPPLKLVWVDSSHIQVAGPLANGYGVSVKVKYHPAWRATQAGKVLPISRGGNGFMSLAPPAGPVKIDLEYNGTPKQHFFGYLSAAAWIVSLSYVVFFGRRRRGVI